MQNEWRVILLAVAGCFLAMAGYGGGPVEVQANFSEAGSIATAQSAQSDEDGEACSVPAARGYSRMVYDAKSHKVYLFGGFSTFSFGNMDILDVWAFDTEENTWRLVGQQGSADYDAFAFDTKSRKVILYQPFVPTADGGCCTGEVQTWAFDVDTKAWENMKPPGEPPPPRFGSRMAYDAESDVVVLFGGSDLFTGETLGDTWAFDYESNTWTNLQPQSSPPPRLFHDMVYDEAGDRVVMFGGGDGVGELGDTWAYDTNTNTWTELHPATPPSARVYAMLAYEGRTKNIVMYGGVEDSTNWPYEPTLDETWVFDLDSVVWTQESPKKVASSRAWHQMVGIGKRVLLFGGGPSRFAYNAETYTYGSRTNKWKLITCENHDGDQDEDDD